MGSVCPPMAAVKSEAGISTMFQTPIPPTISGANELRFVLGAKLGSCGALDHSLLHGFGLVAHWRRIVHR